MQTPTLTTERKFDVICLGRLAVDLYAQQIGARLEDVTSFARYLGGSSANIAFGCARLGLKSAMLSRVGNDHMGRFLVDALTREGCDVSHVTTDRERLTALVLLGLKDRDTFPLVFYRENCADMALDERDFDESFIASSRALLITGTHFSTEQVHRASMKALEYARRNDVRTVLDIDYRPVLWGLTAKADGETRFIADGSVSTHLRGILPMFDLIVGTEEEFRIAGGCDDLLDALRVVRDLTPATLVVKRGRSAALSSMDRFPRTSTTVATTVACRWKCSTSSAPATHSFPASSKDGWRAPMRRLAAHTPTRAVRSLCPDMRALPRCRRRPNLIIFSRTLHG